jgi:hypothetical protein
MAHCAQRAPQAPGAIPAKPSPTPTLSATEPSARQAPPPALAGICHPNRVLTLSTPPMTASARSQPQFMPDLWRTESQHEARGVGVIDLDRVASALFGDTTPPASESVVICFDRGRGGFETQERAESTTVRVYDVKSFTTTRSPAPLLLVVYSVDAPRALLDGRPGAGLSLAVLDLQYRVLARTALTIQRSLVQTLDTVDTGLRLENGLVVERITFGAGCGGDDRMERFDVPLGLGATPTCVQGYEADSYRTEYPQFEAQTTCTPDSISTTSVPFTPSYETTHGQSSFEMAMPYVRDAARASQIDDQRVALTLAPPSAEHSAPTETAVTAFDAAQHVAVGSLSHTTERWSFVRGPQLRLHQLLPIRDGAGVEGFLALYARARPGLLLASRNPQWHVALLSAAYQPLADVAFSTPLSPRTARPWSAFQTALELRDGQPVARVRYLSAPPPLAAAHASSASAAGLRPPESVEFATALSLNLESPCLAAARR